MKKIIALIFLLQSIYGVAVSQEESNDFEPNGDPLALIFTNFHTDFTENNSSPAFDITRVYLGYEYDFSENWYAKVVFDVGNPRAGQYEMTAYLKNAYFQYDQGSFSGAFGMLSTTQFKVAETIWGYRYIEKSFQDAYGFNSSADLGLKISYDFSEFLSADLAITNGEGYKQLQSDELFRTGLGITVLPVETITARIYADYIGDEVKQQSLATLLAYSGERLTVAGEYNFQKNVDMVDGQDMYGTSFYATYRPSDKVKLFGRFDDINSSTQTGEELPWQIEDDGQLVIAGVEFSPVNGVKFSPNFRMWNPDFEGQETINSVFLNCELKF